MLIFLITLTLISISKSDLPFCQICQCKSDADSWTNVTCTKDIGHQLLDVSNWVNPQTNKSYPLKSVTVQNSPILSLDKPFPASDVIILNLANNSIVNISDNIFSKLQNMETLILSYNNIELLDPNTFYGAYLDGDLYPLKSLKNLHLDHNKIHTLDGNAFEHATRVEVLTLSHNPFQILDQNTIIAITSLVYLKKLDLSYTGLADLPEYFMHTPKYINFLDLSGNNFEKIPETLGFSHALSTLYFNSNPIVNLTNENGFPVISTLKVLHMSGMSNLKCIGNGAMSNLTNLTELYLFNNIDLVHLDENVLSAKRDGAEYNTWPPITKLYMQNNKLTRIDMQFFMPWKNLKELDITDNPWTCECENEWMVDELMPIYLELDSAKAKALKCAAPVEMADFTFYDIYQKQKTMRCLDYYGNRPERDGIMLVGVLAGVLVTIPLVLFIIYAYQRHWFGVFDNSPASFSRQFYKRTVSSDEYF